MGERGRQRDRKREEELLNTVLLEVPEDEAQYNLKSADEEMMICYLKRQMEEEMNKQINIVKKKKRKKEKKNK